MTLPPLRRAGHAAIPPSTARRRVIRWFRRQGFLDAHAAAAMRSRAATALRALPRLWR